MPSNPAPNLPSAISGTFRLPSPTVLGNPFIHPWIDYGVIAGGWSIAATFFFFSYPGLFQKISPEALAILILVVNSCHFAASTLRLYTKPDYAVKYPFLTYGFPLVTLLIMGGCLLFPEILGKHLQALYLTWSPFHYAAQTYGLAAMYCFRSGFRLSDGEKWLLWWGCMLPFFRSFLGAPNSGLGWFIPGGGLNAIPIAPSALHLITVSLLVLIFLAPVAVYIRMRLLKGRLPPLIVIVLLVSNGLWWTALDYLDAFVVATIAHGLQYMAIVLVYHVQDRLNHPDNVRPAWAHALRFYGGCLLLGYGLFYCWPYAFVWTGVGLAESMLLVTATINIHHFVVDRYIWRQPQPGHASTISPAAQPA